MTTDTIVEEPAPTALEPRRVLILTDTEQRILLEALRLAEADAQAQGIDLVPESIRHLHSRIAYGEEYVDAVDELDRRTLVKRRLEEEVRRTNRRITTLDEIVVDELVERGERKITRDATGSTLSIIRKVFAKVHTGNSDPSDDEKAAAKAIAAEALQRAGLGDLVRPDFNLNSLSAHFSEQVKAYQAEQEKLPAEQRRPKPVEDFLPDELRGFIDLTDKPKISVRAAD